MSIDAVWCQTCWDTPEGEAHRCDMSGQYGECACPDEHGVGIGEDSTP